MQISRLNDLDKKEIDRLLAAIPFYKEIKQSDHLQLELLLQHSRLAVFEPGEVVVKRGDRGYWLFFVLKGSLAVYLNEVEGQPIGEIISGEMFGDLAILADGERRATVTANPNSSRGATLLGLDFGTFGRLDDFSQIRLETKLQFYRLMVLGIRWKLEQKRLANMSHPLAKAMLNLPIPKFVPGTLQELDALHTQAKQLADLLIDWNNEGQFK